MSFELHQEKSQPQDRFIAQATKLQEILRSVDIPLALFDDARLVHFSKLSPLHQANLLDAMTLQNEILDEVIGAGMSPVACAKTLTMKFLNRHGLKAADEYFMFITEFDHVAIYGLQQEMIFLTPNHFRWTSYTVEDILCRPWFELFKRNDTISIVLRSRVQAVLSHGNRKVIENLDVPPHFITETSSVRQREITVRPKVYSPVYRGDQMTGFLSVNTGTSTHSNSRI